MVRIRLLRRAFIVPRRNRIRSIGPVELTFKSLNSSDVGVQKKDPAFQILDR